MMEYGDNPVESSVLLRASLCSENPWCFSCSSWLLRNLEVRNLVACCVPYIPSTALTVWFVHAISFYQSGWRIDEHRWTSTDPASSRLSIIFVSHCTCDRPIFCLPQFDHASNYSTIPKYPEAMIAVSLLPHFLKWYCWPGVAEVCPSIQTFYYIEFCIVYRWVCLRIWKLNYPMVYSNLPPCKQTCEFIIIYDKSCLPHYIQDTVRCFSMRFIVIKTTIAPVKSVVFLLNHLKSPWHPVFR